MTTWLIGAGLMSREYSKVLKALGVTFEVIGRGKASATAFTDATGIAVSEGGIHKSLQEMVIPETAIIAVGVEELANTASAMIQAGTKRIMLEKPGGLDFAQIKQLKDLASKNEAEVWLGYNRRYYSSSLKAIELIENDGGATSVQFEFTEWSHQIRDLSKASGVKEHWFLANSTHVVDLVFNLCGKPKDFKFFHSGSLDWHPTAARFSGAGVTESGVLFSYLADWEAPGRWGIEILTRKNRLILRPMEQLQIIPLGSVSVKNFPINDELDQNFKPGLYRQTEAFLDGKKDRLCSLTEHVMHARIYSKIAGYL